MTEPQTTTDPVLASLWANAAKNARLTERLLFGIEPPGPAAEGDWIKPIDDTQEADEMTALDRLAELGQAVTDAKAAERRVRDQRSEPRCAPASCADSLPTFPRRSSTRMVSRDRRPRPRSCTSRQ